MSKPRYVLVGFKSNRHTNAAEASGFDACNITDVRLHLNSESYPYDNFKSNFGAAYSQELYHAFNKIQESYPQYSGPNPNTYQYTSFVEQPIFAFDCSRTEELSGGSVDVRWEINASANIPENFSAYCLIIHENQFDYSPFRGIVTKSV